MNEQYKQWEKEFKKLSEVEKWKFIIANKEHFELALDNDATHIKIKGDENYEYHFDFHNWIGWDDGVFELLEAIGIDAEGV